MTIYALSSGPGLSGIAVIRVSGSNTKKVLENLTFSPIPSPKVASLRKFINPETKPVVEASGHIYEGTIINRWISE